jgi:hypothetical protein
MNIVGIDPGLSGAIAELNEKGEIVQLIDMPIISYKKGKKGKRDYVVGAINAFFTHPLLNKEETVVFIEKMQSMPPGFRVQASFGLGYCQGLFEGILTALGIKYELILSKEWKKHFQITKAKGDQKAQAFQIASKLFPEAKLQTERGRVLDGRSDALLLCEYGRRKLQMVRSLDPIESNIAFLKTSLILPGSKEDSKNA